MVTTSPIAFKALPRVSGGLQADMVATQPPYAAAVDADFALIKSWADSTDQSVVVTKYASVLTFATNWTWYITAGLYCDAVVMGGVVQLNVIVKYTGATLTADSYGSVGVQAIGTLAASMPALQPNATLRFVGETGNGMCTLVLDKGSLSLAALGCGGQTLVSNSYVAFCDAYIPYQTGP